MQISRREFLQAAGTMGIFAGSYPLFSGCAGLRRADIKAQDAAVKGLSRDGWRILELASLAPSGHNTQPWGITLADPQTWIVTSDEQRLIPSVDPDQRETLLSIGAFIENLVVAAGCFGYRVDLKLLTESSQDREIAHVTVKTSPPERPDNNPVEKIRLRRVARKGYLGKEIRSSDLSYITNDAPDRFFFFPPSSRYGRYLSEETIAANRQQASRQAAQEELAAWIRWSDSDAHAFRDGLTPEGMEITGIASWYVRHFFDRDDVLGQRFREATIEGVIEQVARHGGWLVITSEDSRVETLLETGRLFQRMFLNVRDRMIAVHPMTQMLEETPWRETVADELGLSGRVQFILRLGYLEKYADPVTLRRPVSWFVRS